MKFGVREICDVVLKAKANQKVSNKIFYKNEPVIYFDTLKTSSMEGAATTVYAQGGRGNSRLMAWEGERTVTFTMEDALISPAGFMILSGAGLVEAESGKPVMVHTTEQVKVTSIAGDTVTITLNQEPYNPGNDENYIYVMLLDDNGEVSTEPYIPDSTLSKKNVIVLKAGDDVSRFKSDSIVLVDYYVAREGGVSEITITPDKFGGYYYLEASTLFRNTDGVDMPAEFVIPNCKIQSNFTFTMASSGDPSTFTFTIDAFPDYTRFDKTKKVLAAIQVITEAENSVELTRDRTDSKRFEDANGMIAESEDAAKITHYSLNSAYDAEVQGTVFTIVPAIDSQKQAVKWELVGNSDNLTSLDKGVLKLGENEAGQLVVVANITDNDTENDYAAYALITVPKKAEG
jgi:hypothetical protein